MDFDRCSDFITRLHSCKEIETHLINFIKFSPQQYSLASLLTILYNSAVINPAKQQIYKYIEIQGEIIKLLASFINKEQPAYSLMQFNYMQFFDFCTRNGQSNLGRYAKGIHPLVNTEEDFIFKFLPYHEIELSRNIIIGNSNWKQAKKVLKMRYNKIKDSLSYSTKLAYCLLLCEQNELKQHFTSQFEKLWLNLYIHYINQGLKVYEYKQDKYQFQYELSFPFHQENEVSLYKAIISFIMSKSEDKTPQQLQYIINKSFLAFPSNDDYTSLIMSILYKASRVFKFQTTLPQEFRWIPNEFYNRIFLSDQDIREVYRSGQLNYIPRYDYGLGLMSYICKTCLEKNPEAIDQRSLSFIEIKTRLYLLMNSPLLGQEQGTRVLEILLKNKEEYVRQLQKVEGSSQQILTTYENFVGLWEKYYHLTYYPNQISYLSQLLTFCPKQYLRGIKLSHPTDYSRYLSHLFSLYVSNLPHFSEEMTFIGRSERFRELLGRLNKNIRDQIWGYWSQAEMNKGYISQDCISNEKPHRRTIKIMKNQPSKQPDSYEIIEE